MSKFAIKFSLSFAYELIEIIKDNKVVGFRAGFNGALAFLENKVKKDYNKWSKVAKDLGRYLAEYRNTSPEVFKDSYYGTQITILEGLKARKCKAAKLLKKIKILKGVGYRIADTVAEGISEKFANYDVHDLEKYDAAATEYKKRLDIVWANIQMENYNAR